MIFQKALPHLKDYNVIFAVGDEIFYKNLIVSSITQDPILLEEDIINTLLAPSLLRDRVFVLKDFEKFKDKKKLLNTLNTFKEKLIIFCEKKYKLKGALLVECYKPKPWGEKKDILNKIYSYMKKNDLKIEEKAAQYLYDQIGYDLYTLLYELQKITLYKKDKIVNLKDVQTLCKQDYTYKIYDLVNYLIDRKYEKALLHIKKIFKYQNTSGILLISMLYKHFENLLYLKSNPEGLQLPETIIKNLITQANKIEIKEIKEFLGQLIDIDYGIRKGSFNPKYHLENIILGF